MRTRLARLTLLASSVLLFGGTLTSCSKTTGEGCSQVTELARHNPSADAVADFRAGKKRLKSLGGVAEETPADDPSLPSDEINGTSEGGSLACLKAKSIARRYATEYNTKMVELTRGDPS